MPSGRARRIGWATLAAALSLIAVEAGFRLGYYCLAGVEAYRNLAAWSAGPPLPPAAHFVPHPNYFYTFDPAESGVNSLGFLGPEPDGASRPTIAVLGDSTVAGEHGWPVRMERLLREKFPDSQVWQWAVPGWSLRECALAARELIPRLHPQVVVVQAGANDLGAAMVAGLQSDYSHWRQPTFGDARGTLRVIRWRGRLFRASRLAAYAARASGQAMPTAPRLDALANRAAAEPVAPDFGPAFVAAVDGHLRTILAACRAGGARLVLTTQPSCPAHAGQAGHGQIVREGMAVINNTIRARAAEADGLLDLAATLDDACVNFTDTIHQNPAGDDAKALLAARALTPILATLTRE